MANIMTKIMSFWAMIVFFLGSFGIGSNPPATIHVTDANGDAVSNVKVYYFIDEHPNESYTISPIGVTDENGNVEWEDRGYDEQTMYVYNEEFDSTPFDNRYEITVSRTVDEVINIQLDFVYGA